MLPIFRSFYSLASVVDRDWRRTGGTREEHLRISTEIADATEDAVDWDSIVECDRNTPRNPAAARSGRFKLDSYSMKNKPRPLLGLLNDF